MSLNAVQLLCFIGFCVTENLISLYFALNFKNVIKKQEPKGNNMLKTSLIWF